MRIRTIKPSFWRSDDITALPMELRLFFVGLWSYVDDNGVGIDDYREIAADLFAKEEDPVAIREFVREGLATLSRGPLVVRYMIDGKRYIFIRTWDEHQRVDRPNKPRYPRPSDDFDPTTSDNGQGADHVEIPSRDRREALAPVVGEEGKRGVEEENTCAPSSASDHDHDAPELTLIEPEAVVPISRKADETFARFWAAYPRKKAKPPARDAWGKAIKRADPETIISAAQRLTASRPDLKYTPYPATWLNRDSWNDEPDSTNGRYQGYQEPADHSVYHQGLLP